MMNQNEQEKDAKEKRAVEQLVEQTELDELDQVKNDFMSKSMYELAEEIENETHAPSLDSYADQDVFLRYKQGKWFESVNILQLKKQRDQQSAEFLR